MSTAPAAPHECPGPVAYQGVPGAFSEEAARAFAGPAGALLACASVGAALDALAGGAAARAALPVENSLAGTVREVARALLAHAVEIEAESLVRVSHALIAPPGVALAAVRRVRSHPVALQQCERFFRDHPELEPVADFDTAGAVVRVVREGRGDEAALASARAAALHGGVVLARALEDDPANLTRFVLLARRGEAAPAPAAGPRKATLVFRTAHRPGALWHCLGVLAGRGIDLTLIESHPVHGAPFEYEFLVDVVASGAPDAIAGAIEALGPHCTTLRHLGTYAPAPA